MSWKGGLMTELLNLSFIILFILKLSNHEIATWMEIFIPMFIQMIYLVWKSLTDVK